MLEAVDDMKSARVVGEGRNPLGCFRYLFYMFYLRSKVISVLVCFYIKAKDWLSTPGIKVQRQSRAGNPYNILGNEIPSSSLLRVNSSVRADLLDHSDNVPLRKLNQNLGARKPGRKPHKYL